MSGPRDLGLALAEPESRAAPAPAQTQIFDQVATATATVLSDVVTSPLQTPVPCAPSPLPSVCGTETTDSVDEDEVDAMPMVLCDVALDVIDPVLDSADGYRNYYDSIGT